MFDYVIRRFLLMIPTFFGTTLLVFLILQLVPSGPFEQAIMQIKMAKMYSGEAQSMEASGDDGGTMELSPKVLDRLRRQYGLDKPIWKRYFIWLGLAKKEIKNKEIEVGVPFRETIKDLGEGEYVSISLQRWVFIYEDENGNFIILESPEGTDFEWITDEYQVLPDPEYIEEWNESNWIIKDDVENDEGILTLVKEKRQGVFTGYLGESSKHKEDVSTLIWDRIHISSFLGITGFILSYLVCIPLGIMKALKHGSKFDIISSGLVFIGFSIPAYAFGVLMLWIFSTSAVFDAPLLPSRGWRPEDWEQLTLMGKMIGQLRHAFLPTLCYMLGSFAGLTILMKNSLMENLSQDYVRTAFSKGLSEKTVIVYHAVRNSLIPLATGIGGLIGIFLASSYLIEKVFGIDGIGMLTFKAIGSRDYGIIMGFVVIATIIRLLGNLISDLCYALIDPRIRFK
jgi:microcin C transport system permease protein